VPFNFGNRRTLRPRYYNPCRIVQLGQKPLWLRASCPSSQGQPLIQRQEIFSGVRQKVRAFQQGEWRAGLILLINRNFSGGPSVIRSGSRSRELLLYFFRCFNILHRNYFSRIINGFCRVLAVTFSERFQYRCARARILRYRPSAI